VSDGQVGMLKALSAPWLVPFLLLFIRDRERYGLELIRESAEFDLGAVYRVLRQMEGGGMVPSEQDGLDCRLSHRKYSITDSGEAHLGLWANYLMKCQKEVDLFFGTYSNGFVREA
jgi:DNA-binding PadR family transcriptional regulator